MTAWVFEAVHCPMLQKEIEKTKLQIYTSPQAGINILLAPVIPSAWLTSVSMSTKLVQPKCLLQSSVHIICSQVRLKV